MKIKVIMITMIMLINLFFVTLSARNNKNYQNFLAKDLKDQFIGMNIKQKVGKKIRQMNLDIFSHQILLE